MLVGSGQEGGFGDLHGDRALFGCEGAGRVQQGAGLAGGERALEGGDPAEPGTLRLVGDEPAGDARQGAAVTAGASGVLVGLPLPDGPQVLECPVALRAGAVEPVLQAVDLGVGGPRVVCGLAFEDGVDGGLQLPLGVHAVAGAADRQGFDLLGEFVLEDLERPGGLAGDEDALAPGEQVGDQVGDGVGLAGAGRALHDDEVAVPQAFGDLALLGVGGQGEVQVLPAGHGGRGGPVAVGVLLSDGRVLSLVVGADDVAEQGGLAALVLDGVGDLAQCVELPAFGAFPQDERGGEGDPGAVSARGVPVGSGS